MISREQAKGIGNKGGNTLKAEEEKQSHKSKLEKHPYKKSHGAGQEAFPEMLRETLTKVIKNTLCEVDPFDRPKGDTTFTLMVEGTKDPEKLILTGRVADSRPRIRLWDK